MEDPWASGSGWGETPKKQNPISLPISTSPVRSPPPAASDPWGAPTPDTEPKSDNMPTFGWSGSPVRDDPMEQSTETPGWGGGWQEPSKAGPSRSPIRRPADSPEWSMSPRHDEEESYRAAMPKIELEHTSPIALAPPIDNPPSPGGFGGSSPPQSPKHTIPDLGGFDDPSLAQSPNFGDEFGGFSNPSRPPGNPPSPGGLDGASTRQSPKHTIPDLGGFDDPPLAQSPKFGDEFGGFSSPSFGDDPWGMRRKEEGWGGSSDHQSSDTPGVTNVQREDPEEGEGWGGSHTVERRETSAVTSSGMDQDWEEAQKRIKVTEQRAPREKIVALQEGWRELVKGVMGENQLADMPEEEEAAYSRALRKRDDDTFETLRSLFTIPPDTNTYPPVLSSMETAERYRYALARPNPTPETSLLNVPLARRSRQDENLRDNLDSWTTRSRLGEPEALPVEAAAQGEDAKPKWSFWRKNTAEKPLVTSGGGILEAKSMSSSPAPVLMEPRASSTGPLPASAPAKSSRPASPAPVAILAADISPNPPAMTSPEPSVPAQSAVGRFFGRLSRRPTSQPTPDDDDKDLALSADDFSFLDQVPSITQTQNQMVGDLLAFEGGRTESMASLESMLNSKATPLPAPLAPPPTWSRSSSSAGPSYQKPKEIDFLEGLDFDNDMGSSSLRPSQATQPASSVASASNWDQLLSSSAHTLAPTSAVPMISSEIPHRTFTPPITPSALSPTPDVRHQPVTSSPAAGSSYRPSVLQYTPTPAVSNDFDDFADFAPPPPASTQTNDFDDFGDFGDFSTSPPAVAQSNTYSTPIYAVSTLKAPPSTGHVKRASLDHTLTLNLMNDASAVRGKRWPAPPSPLAPQLDPPPKASNTSSAFPFISPPPGGRPTSAFGNLLDDGAKASTTLQSSPPSRALSPPIALSTAMAPTRTSSPLTRPPANAAPANPAIPKPTQPPQSGLSAQDLSFFDSL